MAIIKKIELENGVEVNYHNIGFYLNKADNFLNIWVTSWLDEAKRNEGKAFVCSKQYTIPKELWLMDYCEGGNIAEIAYTYVKSLPDFEGGEND